MTRSTFEEITTSEPHKPLLEPQKRGSGRNNAGRSPSATAAAGKAAYRRHRLEARQVRRAGPRGDRRVRPEPLGAHRAAPLPRRREALHAAAARPARGYVVVAGPDAEARVGNALPITNIPLGTTIHNIELVPGRGGQIVRSAGVAPSCWPRKATTPRSGCRPARFAGSASGAWRPSARSATSTTRTRTSARPAAPRHWASGPRSGASSMNPRDHPHGGGGLRADDSGVTFAGTSSSCAWRTKPSPRCNIAVTSA